MAGYFERINVVIDVATKQAQTALTGFRESVAQANTATGKLKAGWANLKQTGPATVAAFVAVGGAIAGVASQLVNAAEVASTANARLLEVNTSMGLFGNQTRQVTQRLIELAEKTALQVGLDANQIKMTQAKLATFLELARSADEVGGAFDRATMAAIDLAAAGFGEATANAVQLGKALQDPIAGISALGESGITFTAAEQKVIRALVEAGEAAKAQGIILTAVENQVGGVAVATATATDKMAASWQQLKERVGEELLPFVEGLAVALGDATQATNGQSEAFRILDDDMQDAFEGSLLMTGAQKEWTYTYKNGARIFDEVGNRLYFLSKGAQEAYLKTHSLTGATTEVRGALGQANDYLKEHAQALMEAVDEADTLADTLAYNRDSLARAAYEAESRIRALYDEIDQKKTWNELRLDILGVREEIDGLNKDLEDKKITAEEYGIELENVFLDGEQGILDFVETLDREVPTEVVTDLLADFRAGDIRGVLARLQSLVDQNPIAARLNVVGGQTSIPSSVRDGSISNNGTYVTVNIGVSGDPIETGRTIIRLINDATAAGGLGNAGRI